MVEFALHKLMGAVLFLVGAVSILTIFMCDPDFHPALVAPAVFVGFFAGLIGLIILIDDGEEDGI